MMVTVMLWDLFVPEQFKIVMFQVGRGCCCSSGPRKHFSPVMEAPHEQRLELLSGVRDCKESGHLACCLFAILSFILYF